MTRYLIYFALVLFAPLIILLSRSIISYIYQWFFPGPDKFNAILRKRNRLHDWDINQCSLTSLFGYQELKFDLEDLNPEQKKYTLMLESRAVLGKVKIWLPQDMSLVIENRGLLGRIAVPGKKKIGLFFSNTAEDKSTVSEDRKLQLLVSSRIIMGSLEIIREQSQRV